MTLAPGCLKTTSRTPRLPFCQAGELAVLRPVARRWPMSPHPHRRAVAIGHDDVVVLARLGQLVVGVDGEGLVRRRRCCPSGALTVALASTLRTSSSVRPMAASFAGIDLHADRRLLLAADQHLRHAGDLRDLLRQDVLGVVVDLDQRQRVGLHRQDHDRRIGRVDLAIGRRVRQVLRQLPGGGVDRRLHVVGGGVDVAVEIELQRDAAWCPARSTDVICATPGICANWRLQRLRRPSTPSSRGWRRESARVTVIVGKSTCGSGATGSSG